MTLPTYPTPPSDQVAKQTAAGRMVPAGTISEEGLGMRRDDGANEQTSEEGHLKEIGRSESNCILHALSQALC
ncbi:hypothetical protein CLCR_06500 [Cladophialophora carrionii]|uniref:Uncharacterized protein n=1 Tax=Cladophialophora carrionii TaxID=86049 RepID=A0A1C1C7E3_9EURO|nr:hypothetical protein CLCR_06500 [Cladophialophora carrionii]